MNLFERRWWFVALPPGVAPHWGGLCACCGKRPAATTCRVRLFVEAEVPGERIRRGEIVRPPSCNRCLGGRLASRVAIALVLARLIVLVLGRGYQFRVAMPIAQLGWSWFLSQALLLVLVFAGFFVVVEVLRITLVPIDLLRRRDGSLICSFRNWHPAWSFARANEIQDDGTSEELRSST
ncbi:MAG: hypothetical protein H6838_02210 [Planctomycetes bacterium]|nr:hypothetical protein [Planctomycetota bacterium]MCB9884273.1 hypothetical protein [Planctomycetota bacterium]